MATVLGQPRHAARLYQEAGEYAPQSSMHTPGFYRGTRILIQLKQICEICEIQSEAGFD